MSLCVSVVSGVLQVSPNQAQPCAEYILMSGQEYSSLPTLADVFAFPLATDLQSMFMTGFSLPVVAYLVAWAYQSVISFFYHDRS